METKEEKEEDLERGWTTAVGGRSPAEGANIGDAGGVDIELRGRGEKVARVGVLAGDGEGGLGGGKSGEVKGGAGGGGDEVLDACARSV